MSIFKKTITTSLSPNIQKNDVLLAIKMLISPWKWTKGDGAQQIEKEFQKYLNSKYAVSFESGRTCLYSILSALDLKSSDEVLIQSYTCVAVPEPVLWVGAKPIYIDINIDSLNMSPEDLEKKITKNSKVLIIQHTFGNTAGLEKLMQIGKKHDLFIIEDCAHALGAEYKGKKAGTFGDVSFFSFGRDKVISSVFGGMVVTDNEEIGIAVEKFRKDECTMPSARWTVQQLLHPIIFSIVKPVYEFFSLGKVILEVSKRLGITSKAVYPAEKLGKKPHFIKKRLPNALSILALHQFKKLDQYNEHRRKLAKIYRQKLNGENLQLLKESDNVTNIFLRFILLINNPSEIHKGMRKWKIYLGDWYDRSIAPRGVDYKKIQYDSKQCPIAEEAAKKTINLPTHIGIKEKDAEKICMHLNQLLK